MFFPRLFTRLVGALKTVPEDLSRVEKPQLSFDIKNRASFSNRLTKQHVASSYCRNKSISMEFEERNSNREGWHVLKGRWQ